MSKPLCFVVMPFYKKKDAEGREVDFDVVYEQLIRPAIHAAGMEAVRADEETVNGIIHKPMYERLILCDYAIADLTTPNANVFYKLGIRHAVKPCTTITIFASDTSLPFDLNFLRGMPYAYDSEQKLGRLTEDVQALTEQLLRAKKNKTTDSPVYQLVDGISFQNSVAHEKTDIFRERVTYNQHIKEALLQARHQEGATTVKVQAVDDVAVRLLPENEEAGVLIDVMLSYRALGAYEKMIAFIEAMPAHVQQTIMVQEQKGFALNRAGRPQEAIAVLEKENGPGSETYSILGRVYKDLFIQALEKGNEIKAESYLDLALHTYLKGFEADCRDAYPGVNAVTLLELKGERESIMTLAPVVAYAVNRKLDRKRPDYWDYATLLELAVIAREEVQAREYLKKALACPVEGSWMLDTTIRNLQLMIDFQRKRQEDATVAEKMIAYLKAQQ